MSRIGPGLLRTDPAAGRPFDSDLRSGPSDPADSVTMRSTENRGTGGRSAPHQ